MRQSALLCGKALLCVTSDKSDRIASMMNDQETIQRLANVRLEHRDLDTAIDALMRDGAPDQLQLARLKKRKLALRDEIAVLEAQLIPDIIA